METGKVCFVSAGPGESDLISVRGLKIIKEADVIIYDYLVDKNILNEAKTGAELICCDTLGKKRHSDGFTDAQEAINQVILQNALRNKKVARLKNGDASIFSRISQEMECLVKNNVEFEIIPGITAASCASAFSGVPLTDRRFSSDVVFVTGHQAKNKDTNIDWSAIAKCGTIVIYMGMENVSDIVKILIENGKSKRTPFVCISNAGKITQKTVTGQLENINSGIKNKNAQPPAIIIIGEVARFEKDFDWNRKNRKILFTGLSEKRYFLKGNYYHLPMIKIIPVDDWKKFDSHMGNIHAFDWIIFTSRYAVRYFFERFYSQGYDSRRLKDISIAAIGNSTKNRLLDFGILPDMMPQKESSEGLLEEFAKINLNGKKIFMPRSDIADKGLTEKLTGLGASITAEVAYKNVMPDNLPALDLTDFDEIIFTSPSTVRNFLKRYGAPPVSIKLRYIGDVTKKEAKKWNLTG
ncbi:MAG: uroporphyrinogen-III C-methyltransferase [Candidatus Omnitrophica bacterium]|nr:uroporphyrinogen-III C-methyltransferase [Candidatus Omnitrophota bacterium]